MPEKFKVYLRLDGENTEAKVNGSIVKAARVGVVATLETMEFEEGFAPCAVIGPVSQADADRIRNEWKVARGRVTVVRI